MTEDRPIPENEEERLQVVQSLGLLDTPPEERFDRYTRFARQLLGVPIAFVSIIGEDTQWFKSAQGFKAKQSSRDLSFCTHTIVEDEMMVVEDAFMDPRFTDNPFVTGPPHIRFYAGVKLHVQDDICIGTLCVADTKARYPSEEELSHLRELAKLLEDEFRTHAQSTTDSLTGLSNRRGLYAIGEQALAMCRRDKKAASLMYLQLSDFRGINAEQGRDVGDQVLKDVAQLLLNEFRHSDVVARAGADEFFILFTGTGLSRLKKPMANLERAFHEENMNLPFSLEYNTGAIEWNPDQHADIEALMKAADDAVTFQEDSAPNE
jgi:diguanylate cyclase (GGDEF)-like protein